MVGDPESYWFQFKLEGSGGVILEAGILVSIVAAQPANWTLSVVDSSVSQGGEELGLIFCGAPFNLEVEATDQYNNRFGLELWNCFTVVILGAIVFLTSECRTVNHLPLAWSSLIGKLFYICVQEKKLKALDFRVSNFQARFYAAEKDMKETEKF